VKYIQKMDKYFYTYVLRSLKDGKFYTGYTKDLNVRFELHNRGKVQSTKHRTPFEIIYFEACINKNDAIKREKYIKTFYGKMYLKKRLKSYFTSQEEINNKIEYISNE
jgi:putative endonuclease